MADRNLLGVGEGGAWRRHTAPHSWRGLFPLTSQDLRALLGK